MGTKRPSCTLFDTVSNVNTSDRKLQPGGKISRDPSPRPVMTAQSERGRDSNREEDRRREREMNKKRDKARYKNMDPQERHSDRATAPRVREGEREWRERERWQEDDRGRNGRLLSNLERDTEREVERGMKKGDTFPRMTKSSAECNRGMMSATEIDDERGERRQRDRPKQTETDDWERERERAWQRERHREREREEIRSRPKEEGRKGYQESDVFQDRGREVGDTWDRRERDAARKREKPRPNMGEREARMPSPRRRRDRDMYSDRKEREEAQRREGKRDTRSEGDSDERELRRERVRDKEREVIYQHSRSEGDNKGKRARERDRNRLGDKEEDRQRYRDRDREAERSRRRAVEKERERYRDADRRPAREAERWRESGRDLKNDRAWSSDRRDDDRYREQRRDRDRKEREADPRWDDRAGRSSRSQNKTPPMVPPQSQSSGEWSSDMDSETRYKSGRDSYEERESGREGTTERDRDVEEQRAGERRGQTRSERQEVTGSAPEQRRMWLEPQRGKNSKEEFLDGERERHVGRKESSESLTEWRGEGQRVKEEPDERYLDQSSYRQRHAGRNEFRVGTEREMEGVSVDEEDLGEVWRETDKGGKGHLSNSSGGLEGNQRRDVEGENMTDNTEESDREEEGWGDNLACYKKGGSESGWRQDRDSMLSGEDGFVTVSSGGDEEDEKEEDEEFEDCQEFWEGRVAYDRPSPVGFEVCEGDEEREGGRTTGREVDEEEWGREKQRKYVFCVIGQTLPRSNPAETSLSQADPTGGVESNEPNIKRCHRSRDDQHLTLSRNDEYQIINNKDTKGKSEQDMTREERVVTGETTEVDIKYRASPELQDTETGEEMRSKVERLHAEIGQIKRDSQTERLLTEWREKNKDLDERKREQLSPVPSNPYADVCSEASFEQIQPILDGLNTAAMSPEEVEAIRIRMSGAWSMSEEPKRHSQAPHLKWAKDVVREILGHSEEQTVDEPNSEERVDQAEDKQQQEEVVKVTTDQQHSEPELEEDEPLEVEGLRGMGQSQADMHADQFRAMHGVTPTHTHADTLLDTEGKEDHNLDKETEPSGHLQLEKSDIELTITREGGEEVTLSEIEKEESRKKEVEMYLSVSTTLYKPNSCPILNYESDSDLLVPSREGESHDEGDKTGESEEERQEGEPEEKGMAAEMGKTGVGEETEGDSTGGNDREMKEGTVMSTCSFRYLGPEARIRRRGIRKTTERRHGVLVDVEEEEGVGRDRRTRIFSTTDDDDDRSKSWGEVELRNVLDTIGRRKRNSKFFNAAQLYQQYSEAAQNFEILRQSRSDVLSVCEDNTPSPAPSPPPARRPLPPLPPVPHPHSLSHTGSITSVKSLPLPEPPRSEGRPSSPRLSISLAQSPTLWRDLPGVRNSGELEELTEDQRRLQEVRFEVVTSEASYCRSLDIVVEHFVKSKQLGALLTTQDRNWLFSRLADVRAISHSFLSKLEERVESDMVHFTVCDIITRHCQRFRMVYVPYLTNQSYQDATYQRLMNENQGFKRIVEKLERSPVCQRLPLRSFLVLPFQRITRIKLLVQNIVKRTTPGTVEAMQAIKALKLLEKLIQESNDSISQMKSIESLVSLSAKVDFECRTLPLISQSRRLVREGPVTELMDFSLKDTERSVYLHLFNDYLLLSLQKEGGKFTVIDHSPVSDLRVENCRVKLHSLQKNLFRLHMSNKSLLLRTDTQSDKLRWISALSRPQPEVDFSAAQDFPQMQCIRAFVAQQSDELSLEKADIILVHQQSSDHWVEGTRLSDRHYGWVPESHLETITNSRVRQRNLSDALKLTTATAAV
ncbi:zinc finger CCCH domain-containing protein 13 isoform X1 [Lates calcarifer]|uniref:Zinc finger CCCH domain-containing protein 13 isoform X1 n=1 Tax=Lates calcarifer TaxID=8187 RepID=A0AAJ7V6Y8_LATCA|nr:zinc finger CCCH domain-containing protein 13 isoform X1 [Lates calcarifer]